MTVIVIPERNRTVYNVLTPVRITTRPPVITTLVLDTFTGPNGTAIQSRAPDIDGVGGGWLASAGLCEIQSNEARATNSIQYEIQTNEADITLTSQVQMLVSFSGSGMLIVRYTSNLNHWRIDTNTSTGNTRLREVNGGSTTTRGSITTLNTPATYQVEAICSGATITVNVTGASTGTTSYASATHNQTATKHGLRSNLNNQVEYDNFTITKP